MDVTDLTQLLVEPVPCYPGDPGFKMSLAGCYPASESTPASSNMTVCVHALSLSTHTGTHIDAPFHFFPAGRKLHEIPLAQFIGRAIILDVRHLAQDRRMITWVDMMNSHHLTVPLSRIGSRTDGKTDIVVLWTGWDVHWGTPTYFAHPYFSRDVATALLDLDAKIVGVDTLNPDETAADQNGENEHGWGMHEVLLGHGAIICENLKGLGALVNAGSEEETWVSLAPLNVHGADGSPVRAYGWKQRSTLQ